MMRQIKLIIVLLVAILALIEAQERPSYIGCLNSIECSASQCCTISQQKYSSPTCDNLGIIGSSCRPNNEPQEFHVSYPDGFTAILTNTYLNLCNCSDGLECEVETLTCQASNVTTQ
ncbi:hypothetical protein L9F63_009448 [Diploptera punctata]|uniref:Astakine n=1 Tax=Diploptera punctata TaxID=6984 RepID=A0AAD8AL93_DIPPU|nr:hypothetical protein L9F63_009448 [Diploptera punctata]